MAVSGLTGHRKRSRADGGASEVLPVHSSVPSDSIRELDPTKAAVFAECRAALEKELTGSLSRLFSQLTGLPLHVLWHQPFLSKPEDRSAVSCPKLTGEAMASGRPPTACRICVAKFWQARPEAISDQRRFAGACGCTNLCNTLRLERVPLLTLVVQAQVRREEGKSGPETTPPLRQEAAAGQLEIPASLSPAQVTEAGLKHAEALLQLLVHDLDATARACLKEHQLHAACRGRKQRKAAAPGRPLPPAATGSDAGARHGPGTHARQTVHAMLAYIHQHYHHPMALRQLAESLGMNANYLSDLFHKILGVTYHQYLDELRLAKAEELLRDTHACVCDVSCAVGYASPNHFRHVFKLHHGGLSPCAWREAVVRPVSA